ncbi:MAG: hypothetical protein IT379_29625 [Deltaproteobacteria bacterium]|nr:hypothetical protein [Deltaproteobacteria bacterium]
MLRPALVLGLVSIVVACGGAPPREPRARTGLARPRAASPDRPRVAPVARCDSITARVDEGNALAAYGSYPSRLSLVPEGTGFRVFYPSAYDDPLASAPVAADGSLGPAGRAPVDLRAEPHRVSRPTVASIAGTPVMAAGVFVTDRNADVLVARGTADGRLGTAAPLLADPALDLDPSIAPAPDRGFAVAWRHGAYPHAPDLAFARVDRDGRTLGGGVVVTGAQAGERLALVHVPGVGWALLYATVGTERELVLVRIGLDGAVLERRVVASGGIADPVAAWDGSAVSVAYHLDATGSVLPSGAQRSGVGWLRLGPDGRALAAQVVVEEPQEPSASPSPSALVFEGRAFWLASVVSFPTVIVDAVHDRATGSTIHRVRRESPYASIVRIDREGRPRARATIEGVSTIHLVSTPDGVRGVLVESELSSQGSLRSFAMRCAR